MQRLLSPTLNPVASIAPPRLQRPATHALPAFPKAWECSYPPPLPSVPRANLNNPLVLDKIQVPAPASFPGPVDRCGIQTCCPSCPPGVTLAPCQLSLWHVLGMIKSGPSRDVEVSARYIILRERPIPLVESGCGRREVAFLPNHNPSSGYLPSTVPLLFELPIPSSFGEFAAVPPQLE